MGVVLCGGWGCLDLGFYGCRVYRDLRSEHVVFRVGDVEMEI